MDSTSSERLGEALLADPGVGRRVKGRAPWLCPWLPPRARDELCGGCGRLAATSKARAASLATAISSVGRTKLPLWLRPWSPTLPLFTDETDEMRRPLLSRAAVADGGARLLLWKRSPLCVLSTFRSTASIDVIGGQGVDSAEAEGRPR